MQAAALILFLLGLLVAGVLGTETRLLFFWPGCALLGLAGVMAAFKWRLRVMFPPSDWCLGAVLLFAGYLAGRAWFSPVEIYAREDGFILAGCLLSYIFTATVASHPRWRLALLSVLLCLAVGNLAMGSIHLSGRWDFHVVPHFVRTAGEGRIGGFFANPNHLAAFLLMVLFPAAGWLCFGRGGAALKLWLAFVAVSMVIGISLTLSRGAFMGLATGGFIFALVSLWVVWETQRHLFWRLLLAGAAMVVLGGAVLWKVNEEYLRTRMVRSPLAEDVRLGIWDAALTQHSQAPVIGEGARMFYDGSIRYRSPRMQGGGMEALFAHNEYIQLLADYGWLGVGLLGLCLITHALNGLRFLWWFVRAKFVKTGRVASSQLALTMGALAALAAQLVHALFEFQFHVPITALTGAIVLGVLANPGFEAGEFKPVRVPGVRLGLKFAMVAAALAALAGTWFFGRADYEAAQAEIAALRKEPMDQISHLDSAIALDSRNPQTFYQRGLARLNRVTANQRGVENPVLKRATADLEAAVKLNPSSYLYRVALADAYDAQGRYDEALKAIHEAIRLAPLHEEPRLALGLHWHRLGRFAQAEMAYFWAGEAPAYNMEGSARWIDNYRELLRHAALFKGNARSNGGD